jgi:hypothetical protein
MAKEDDGFLFEEDYDETLAEDIPERECYKCGEPFAGTQLDICRICLREFCGECAYRGPWGRFCSENCNESYFYGEGEGDDDDDENSTHPDAG